MKKVGTILSIVLVLGLIFIIVIIAIKGYINDSPISSTPQSSTNHLLQPVQKNTSVPYEAPIIDNLRTVTLTPTSIPSPIISTSLPTIITTPLSTDTPTSTPTSSPTATITPSPTPYIGPTPTPTLAHSSEVTEANNCLNTNDEILLDCWYKVQAGETFQSIVIKVYRVDSQKITLINRLVEILYNVNRTPYGTYREPLYRGTDIFIPQVYNVESENIYRVPYPFCERNRPSVKPTLPCYFKTEPSDTWETISREVCLNEDYSENIKHANRRFINGLLVISSIDLTDNPVIVIPRSKRGECK